MGNVLEESPKLSFAGLVFALCAFVAFYFARAMPSGDPTSTTGVIEITGNVSYTKQPLGTSQAASVRLSNGAVVYAYVISGGPYSPGDSVAIRQQQYLIGPPSYQVIAKNSAH